MLREWWFKFFCGETLFVANKVAYIVIMITSLSNICLSFQGTGSMYEELWGSHTQRSCYKRYDGYLQRISQSKIKENLLLFSSVLFSPKTLNKNTGLQQYKFTSPGLSVYWEIKWHWSGLSFRAGDRRFSPATKRVAPGYFYWKIKEK